MLYPSPYQIHALLHSTLYLIFALLHPSTPYQIHALLYRTPYQIVALLHPSPNQIHINLHSHYLPDPCNVSCNNSLLWTSSIFLSWEPPRCCASWTSRSCFGIAARQLYFCVQHSAQPRVGKPGQDWVKESFLGLLATDLSFLTVRVYIRACSILRQRHDNGFSYPGCTLNISNDN